MPWVRLNDDTRYARRLLAETKGLARFLLDNNVDAPALLRFLDGKGLSAQALPVRFIDRPDDEVLSEAWRQDRILLTHDNDFLDSTLHPPHFNPGIVVMPGGSGNIAKYFPTIGHMLNLIKPYRKLWLQTYVHIQDSHMVIIKGVNATTGYEIEPWALRFDDDGNPYGWEPHAV